MMKRIISIVLLLTVGVVAGVSLDRYLAGTDDGSDSRHETALEHAEKHLDPDYVCPMHSQIVSSEQGSCPICGMALVAIKTSDAETEDTDDIYPVVRVPSSMINNMGVRVAQVKRKTLVRTIETPGFIQQMSKESYTRYTAPAKGRIHKILFESGQWHEAGEALMELELDDLVLVQEKHLELLAAQAQAAELMTTQEVTQEDEIKSSSDAAVDAQTTEQAATADPRTADTKAEEPKVEAGEEKQTDEKESAEPTLEKTRLLMIAAGMTEQQIAALEQTKKTSPLITLYASHAGEVKDLRVAAGDEVKPKTMLFTLGGLMRVSVLANAFQRDASWVKAGQDVDIILPHDSNKAWKGKVSSGAVTINTNSQNIGVKLIFTAPDSVVKSGMYVVGHIYGRVKKDTLVLPRESVIYSRDQKRVIVALGNGRFKPVPVETGISNDTEIEILSGLEDGDTVVVSAQFLIDSESSLQASYRRMTGVE